jgi:SynChlorMet cassette radical SAM/SPASM protein ScmF
MLYVYLTEGCNLWCRHCWIMPAGQGAGAAGRCLNAATLTSLVDQALPLGLAAVKLTGGEPLLHPELPEILRMLRERNLKCVLETNGTLMTPALAAAIAAGPAPQVTVSLDGAQAATHDWLRRTPGCFARALAGIEALAAAGVRPQLIMTVLRANAGQVEALVRLAERLGAGSVKFNVLQPVARGRELVKAGEGLPLREMLALACRVEEDLAPQSSVPLFFHHPMAFRPLSRLFDDRALGCGQCGIMSILGVLADGSLALCGIGRHVPELVFGDGARDSLRAVWERHPKLQELRQGLPGRLQGVCGECLMRELCLGGCVASNYDTHGSYWGPFWYCELARQEGLFPASRVRPGRSRT